MEMEWKSEEINNEIEKADKRRNPFRFEATSAAPTMVRKPDDASVSPPLKARKFGKYVDEVPRGEEGIEHLLKIPEGVAREVLGGNDGCYDLPDGTAEKLEMRIGWAR